GSHGPHLAVLFVVPARERDHFAVRRPGRRIFARNESFRRQTPRLSVREFHQPEFSNGLIDEAFAIWRSSLPTNELCLEGLVTDWQWRIRHFRNGAVHMHSKRNGIYLPTLDPDPPDFSALRKNHGPAVDAPSHSRKDGHLARNLFRFIELDGI